jgi:5-methyltetrahydropteroyltriglutamate--homocysteine methyltransferase
LQITVKCFEKKTGSPVISNGEQRKSSFATYPLDGLDNIDNNGISIPFEDGHCRQLPHWIAGPFRYQYYAVDYLQAALIYASVPVNQAVISASAPTT